MLKDDIIQAWIKKIDELLYRDVEKLDAILEEIDAALKNFSAQASPYRADLKMIRFSPWSAHAGESDYKRRWEFGKSEILNIFKKILENPTVLTVPVEFKEEKIKPKKTHVPSSQVQPEIPAAVEEISPAEPAAVEPVSSSPEPVSPPTPTPLTLKRVFIVHSPGDHTFKTKVAPKLKDMGLDLVFSKDKANASKPMIQKFLEFSDVGFVVVVLSAENFFYDKDQKPKDAKMSAAQTIVFELGYMLGKLGRDNVLVLYPEKKNFELPSQFFDAFYAPLDKAGHWQKDLAQRLRGSGYIIQTHTITRT